MHNNKKMKIIPVVLITSVLFSGCKDKQAGADAYGNFEVTEVIVSSETGGRILEFIPAEGSKVEKEMLIALIDTTILHLQKAEAEATIGSIRTRLNSISAQNKILETQIANLRVNISRIENMLKDDAATRKQYDDLTGQVDVLRTQIEATNTQKASTLAEISVIESKKATLLEQIKRCRIISPINGTVIEKYSEAGEITAAGKPLAKLADLSVMKLKVYVSGGRLADVKIGNPCTVRIDDGEKGFRSFTGKVITVSEKAEFTPKIIQTKEERVTLVYAVTIEVQNDGSMKSGMPGEAIFSENISN
jgi:HlyD family secretion protein